MVTLMLVGIFAPFIGLSIVDAGPLLPSPRDMDFSLLASGLLILTLNVFLALGGVAILSSTVPPTLKVVAIVIMLERLTMHRAPCTAKKQQ